MKFWALHFLFLPTACVLLFACEPQPISELSEGDGIQRIRENHGEKNWEVLSNEVNEYRARYPYSQYANEALLLVADSQFQSSRCPEAIVSYEEFLQRNKTHPKIPEASFRIAKCYDLRSSEAPDREQDYTKRAIVKYNEFISSFSKSENTAEAHERSRALKRRLAEHQLFIARFYWKKEQWHAALSRYLDLRTSASEYSDIMTEATSRAQQAYENLANILEKDPKSDAVIYFKGQTPADLKKAAANLK
jgi:outer membrane protein assembly factor BamD